jgi:NodT family efflux transporter outer membrane factor (OMF) lipoprotein
VSCTHLGPEYEQPETASPQQWQEIDNSVVRQASGALMDWQEGDETLAQLKALLAKNNQDLQVAALNYARSRVQGRIADSANDPQVSLSGGVSRQRLSEHGVSSRFIGLSASGDQYDALVEALTSPYNVYSTGFDASWEPDLWGKVANQIRVAQANEMLASYEYDHLNLVLQTELMRLYTVLRTQQYILSSQRALLHNIKDQKALYQALYSGGLAGKANVLSLASQVLDIEQAIGSTLSQVHQLSNQLTLLVGEQPGKLTSLLDAPTDELTKFASLPLALPSEVLRQRPDIRSAEAKLRAATAAIGIAEADLYPQFSLSGNFGIEAVSSSTVSDWASRSWSLGSSFYLPVFNRGQLQRQVQLRELAQQQAAIQYQQQVLAAWTEVDTAIDEVNTRITQLAQKHEVLGIQQEQLSLLKAQRDSGLTSEQQWLHQQGQVLRTQMELAQATLAYNLSQLSLYKAVGGVTGATQDSTS